MKSTLIITFLTLVSTMVLGQNKVNDASYSSHNYKHPNKAAYAKQYDLDKSTVIKFKTAKRNEDYKHPFNKKSEKSKATVEKKEIKSNKTYKHPYGI